MSETSPPEPNSYLTVEASVRAPAFKVRGSTFITDIVPVRSRDEVDRALAEIRKEFYDATHHCFAYRLGPEGLLLRAADDGEPAGTAGKPILLVLTSARLTDTLLVVTRYFGGTKLGTGGLARAYAEAAQHGVSIARIVRMHLMEEVKLTVSYEDLPQLERLLAHFEAIKGDSSYLDGVHLQVRIRKALLNDFRAQLTEIFHGRVGIL